MFNKKILLLIVLFITTIQPVLAQTLHRYTFEQPKMGTTFQIICYASNASIAQAAADSAFSRIDELNSILSHYQKDSELSKLSRKSGSNQAIAISSDLFTVLVHAQRVARNTNGAFDITIGPLTKLWRKLSTQPNPKLPPADKLKALKKRVGFGYIILDKTHQTALLKVPHMLLDLGGIAKGYTVNEALEVLQSFGISSALVNGGGDIAVSDAPPGSTGWHIAIPHPQRAAKSDPKIVVLHNQAIATSGKLFQSIKINGVSYSHIISPTTGLGLTMPIQVSVIAPNGMYADAWASAVSVLGPIKGKTFIESKNKAAVYIEYLKNNNRHQTHSSNFNSFLYHKVR